MSYYLYAGYPDAKVIDCNYKEIQHLLWGDWVRIKGKQRPDGYYPVYVRGENGWVHKDELQKERLLEVVFVDVGQGDGCLVVTPEDKHIVIDAGDSNNMYRFLNWRYAGFKKNWTFEFAIITHPDKDHYNGFFPLFKHANVNFKTVYHNGIMQEYDPELGPVKKIGKQKYLEHLVETKTALRSFLNQKYRWQNKSYSKLFPKLMNTVLTSGRVNDIRMLSTEHSQDGYVPCYGVDEELSLQILGPVVERDGDQKLLRAFGDKPGSISLKEDKTKNGHSVVLLLKYRDIRVLLGGDLNKSAEDFLLRHYSGIDARYPYSDKEEDKIVSSAQTVFGCDIAKVCHHGSADVTDAMLRSISPAAAVVSSGDNESHAHPRPEILGALGRYGRGRRPLIFSTELMRSTREDEGDAWQEIARLRQRINSATKQNKRKKYQKLLDELVDNLAKRNVITYGAINLRTDGRRAVMAYKLERPRSYRKKITKWDIYKLERAGQGPFVYLP